MIGSPGFNFLIITKASRLQTTIEIVSSCSQLLPNCENMLFQMDADKCFHNDTLFFFYKNIFYKNIEAEICEILRIF